MNLCFYWSIAETSSMYEQCSVLFNVGALQSQIAKVQNFSSDDGLKSAAKYFQVRERGWDVLYYHNLTLDILGYPGYLEYPGMSLSEGD